MGGRDGNADCGSGHLDNNTYKHTNRHTDRDSDTYPYTKPYQYASCP